MERAPRSRRAPRRRRAPEPDWSSRLLDAHAEGWAAVGGAVAPRARGGRRELGVAALPGARAAAEPALREPLLLPSLVQGLEPSTVNGWPAFTPEAGLPQDQTDTALFDGRIVVRLPPRSGRRRP